MFLHLGGDTVIPTRDVIFIADKETTASDTTKEFLEVAYEEGFVVDVSDGEIKSFIVTNKNVYYSSISSLTLKKRANFVRDFSEE